MYTQLQKDTQKHPHKHQHSHELFILSFSHNPNTFTHIPAQSTWYSSLFLLSILWNFKSIIKATMKREILSGAWDSMETHKDGKRCTSISYSIDNKQIHAHTAHTQRYHEEGTKIMCKLLDVFKVRRWNIYNDMEIQRYTTDLKIDSKHIKDIKDENGKKDFTKTRGHDLILGCLIYKWG